MANVTIFFSERKNEENESICTSEECMQFQENYLRIKIRNNNTSLHNFLTKLGTLILMTSPSLP